MEDRTINNNFPTLEDWKEIMEYVQDAEIYRLSMGDLQGHTECRMCKVNILDHIIKLERQGSESMESTEDGIQLSKEMLKAGKVFNEDREICDQYDFCTFCDFDELCDATSIFEFEDISNKDICREDRLVIYNSFTDPETLELLGERYKEILGLGSESEGESPLDTKNNKNSGQGSKAWEIQLDLYKKDNETSEVEEEPTCSVTMTKEEFEESIEHLTEIHEVQDVTSKGECTWILRQGSVFGESTEFIRNLADRYLSYFEAPIITVVNEELSILSPDSCLGEFTALELSELIRECRSTEEECTQE